MSLMNAVAGEVSPEDAIRGPLSRAWNQSIKGSWGLFGSLVGSSVGRVFAAGAAGAIYGGMTSGEGGGAGTIRDAMMGAGVGLGLGLMTTKPLLRGAYSIGKGAVKAAPGVAMTAARAGLSIGDKALGFIGKHPMGALALGLGAYGGYKLMTSRLIGGTDADTTAFAKHMGTSSIGGDLGMGGYSHQDYGRDMFMQSTQGLVQGMHRGRHR